MDREKFKAHYWDKGFNFVNENGPFSVRLQSLPEDHKPLIPVNYVEIKFKLDPDKLVTETWDNFLSEVNKIRTRVPSISLGNPLNFEYSKLVSIMFKREEADKLMREIMPFYINNGIAIDSPKDIKNIIREVTLRFRGLDRFYDAFPLEDPNSYNITRRRVWMDKFFDVFKSNFGCNISGHGGVRNMFLEEKESQDYVYIKVLIANPDQVKTFRSNLKAVELDQYIDFVYSFEEKE